MYHESHSLIKSDFNDKILFLSIKILLTFNLIVSPIMKLFLIEVSSIIILLWQ